MAESDVMDRLRDLEAENARLREGIEAIAGWQHIKAQDDRIAELEEALESLVDEILRSRRGFCGDHFVYTPQINERSMEKARAALAKNAPTGSNNGE